MRYVPFPRAQKKHLVTYLGNYRELKQSLSEVLQSQIGQRPTCC